MIKKKLQLFITTKTIVLIKYNYATLYCLVYFYFIVWNNQAPTLVHYSHHLFLECWVQLYFKLRHVVQSALNFMQGNIYNLK